MLNRSTLPGADVTGFIQIKNRGEYSIYSVCRRKVAKDGMNVNFRELEADIFVISPIREKFAPIGIEELFIPLGVFKS